MSRFSRAYDAALRHSSPVITRTEAGKTAKIDPSVLSRILNDDRDASAEHVAALVRILTNEQDREHCVREFLYDQCPAEYREKLVLHFGILREDWPRRADPLSNDLSKLDKLSTDNPALRRTIASLVKLMENS